jgi:8-oxo-dGTP pyrophosphatase MutT (NUDIX family)
MRVREDEILRSNGVRGIYGVVEKDDAAIILPIDQGRIWLVEQFRYTIQERAMELPQGGWEREIDEPEALARGELKEETGLVAAEMIHLGDLWIAYGFLRHRADSERESSRRRGARPGGALCSSWRVRGDDAHGRDSRRLHARGLGALYAVEGKARVRTISANPRQSYFTSAWLFPPRFLSQSTNP